MHTLIRIDSTNRTGALTSVLTLTAAHFDGNG
jgi:hypothetical protein